MKRIGRYPRKEKNKRNKKAGWPQKGRFEFSTALMNLPLNTEFKDCERAAKLVVRIGLGKFVPNTGTSNANSRHPILWRVGQNVAVYRTSHVDWYCWTNRNYHDLSTLPLKSIFTTMLLPWVVS